MKQLYKKAVVYTNKSGLPLDIVEVKEFECKEDFDNVKNICIESQKSLELAKTREQELRDKKLEKEAYDKKFSKEKLLITVNRMLVNALLGVDEQYLNDVIQAQEETLSVEEILNKYKCIKSKYERWF